MRVLIIAMLSTMACLTATAQDDPKSAPPRTDPSKPEGVPRSVTGGDVDVALTPMIDEKADSTLKRMGEYLVGLKQFRFQADVTVDEVADNDQKLQFTNQLTIDVQRPNRVRTVIEGDTRQRRAWYDGQQVSIIREDQGVWCQVDAPDTIDEMFDFMAETYNVAPPAADFLRSDVYSGMREEVRVGRYLGVHRVGAQKCHHLAFTQGELDWQIWIDEGDKPLPRKFVITYKREPQSPQYAIVFTSWDTSPKFDDKHFAFVEPANLKKVEMIPVGYAPAPDEATAQTRTEK
jgi:hypothetical protein